MTCPTCDRPGFVGCGNHVEQVLGDVPPADRCHCTAGSSPRRAAGARQGWFSRLAGR